MKHEPKRQGQAAEYPRGESGVSAGRIIYQSDDLLKGHREVWIEHHGELYNLKLTLAGRLYLTK